MKKLGAEIRLEDGYVIAKARKGQLRGNKITFPQVSVGATENAIIASVFAKGETIIKNAQWNQKFKIFANVLFRWV